MTYSKNRLNDEQTMKRLYFKGHDARYGYGVSVEYQAGPPVRFYRDRRHAFLVVGRFNRRFGQIPEELRQDVAKMIAGWEYPISEICAFALVQHFNESPT